MMRPYLSEKVRGGGVEVSALLVLGAIIYIVYWWLGLLFSPPGMVTGAALATGEAVRTVQMVQVVNFPTSEVATEIAKGGPEMQEKLQDISPTVTPTHVPTLEAGYEKIIVVARFSRYWPPALGTNCHGDCEAFADGQRVDRALAEGWRVVACPNELLLGTRLEYPPGSGLIWVCRDRGEDIYAYYAENGLFIYWFDFMSEVDFVDYGSYIQVEIYVPNNQVEMMP